MYQLLVLTDLPGKPVSTKEALHKARPATGNNDDITGAERLGDLIHGYVASVDDPLELTGEENLKDVAETRRYSPGGLEGGVRTGWGAVRHESDYGRGVNDRALHDPSTKRARVWRSSLSSSRRGGERENQERQSKAFEIGASHRSLWQRPQLTRRVFLRMKSIRMNCPSVIVFVKYALPRQIADTFFTNSTRLRSRASMNVLIRIPERRHSATSR